MSITLDKNNKIFLTGSLNSLVYNNSRNSLDIGVESHLSLAI